MQVEGLEGSQTPHISSVKVYRSKARAWEAAVLLLSCPHPSLPVVASTSHPHPSHYKVHAGPCRALEHGGAGDVDGVVPLAAPADEGKARMSGNRWAPFADLGEGAEGARGGQSLGSEGEGFPHVDAGFHGRGSAHTQGARGDAHTRSLARRRARRHPARPQAAARSSDLGEGTWESRGWASVGTGAWASVVNRAGEGSPRGGERLGAKGSGGGSLCRGPVARSVGERVSAGGLAPGGRSWAFGQKGSK